MKKLIVISMIGLLAQQVIQAQGMITYLSNIGQSSTGSQAVGSDSWWATPFIAGNDIGGYVLNSVQIGMTNASGNPGGFTVMVYSAIFGAAISPGSSLGTLNGSANPSTSGIYTYTTDSNLTLSPNMDYFIVLTAGTTIVTGAYEWDYAGSNSYNSSGGWSSDGGYFMTSSNGSSWHLGTVGGPQYAITATPIPEPSSLALIGLSSLIFILRRK